MVGIILAGGSGTRLHPLTLGVSKQLLPIYSVPMLYHPLTFLMKAGINEFVVITNPENVEPFKKVLGDGSQWGCEINIIPQEQPEGIAQAYLIAEPYTKGKKTVLILGDNVFYGAKVKKTSKSVTVRHELNNFTKFRSKCKVFGYQVKDPERYGVIEFDDHYNVRSVEEKPTEPKSNYAAVGLYVCDETAPDRVRNQKKSARGEYEITDLMMNYLSEDGLEVSLLDNGTVWLDAGTKHSYVEAINFVEAIEERTGSMIACPEECALKSRFINKKQLAEIADNYPKGEYRDYLYDLFLKNST
jgi:glucose-1-phosphate thymidylyltransferase